MIMAALRRRHNSFLLSQNCVNPSHFQPRCTKTDKMQRLLLALMAAAASAFAPQVSTPQTLVRLQANPIDIYSAAAARNCDFDSS